MKIDEICERYGENYGFVPDDDTLIMLIEGFNMEPQVNEIIESVSKCGVNKNVRDYTIMTLWDYIGLSYDDNYKSISADMFTHNVKGVDNTQLFFNGIEITSVEQFDQLIYDFNYKYLEEIYDED